MRGVYSILPDLRDRLLTLVGTDSGGELGEVTGEVRGK